MPAYIIGDVRDAWDEDALIEYRRRNTATVESRGGRFIVRGGEMALLEGEWDTRRIVVIEFPDMATARDWYESEDYAPLKDAAPLGLGHQPHPRRRRLGRVPSPRRRFKFWAMAALMVLFSVVGLALLVFGPNAHDRLTGAACLLFFGVGGFAYLGGPLLTRRGGETVGASACRPLPAPRRPSSSRRRRRSLGS